MSIVQRIQERQGASVGEAVNRMDTAAAEAERPDAVQQAKQGREAHSKAIRQAGDVELTEQVEAGPEEQKMHEVAEKQLINMIHAKGQSASLLKAVFAHDDPVLGVGNIASDIVLQLQDKNPLITEDVLSSIGERAVEEIVEIVETANPRIDMSEDEMSEAYSIGLQNYMKNQSAQVDEGELQEFLGNV
tara:strand:+ start:1896 stop:2462 length:567 start_codon:yes stop_codon:yes gene_type:complete